MAVEANGYMNIWKRNRYSLESLEDIAGLLRTILVLELEDSYLSSEPPITDRRCKIA